MSDEDRCPECGSWGWKCDSSTPVEGCRCVRCANAEIARLTHERDEEVAHREASHEEYVRACEERDAALAEIAHLTNKLNEDSQHFQIECQKAEIALVREEARAEIARLQRQVKAAQGLLEDTRHAFSREGHACAWKDHADQLRAFLADMEWADGPGYCSWCGNHRSDGHRAGCSMAQMLKGDLKDADPKRT